MVSLVCLFEKLSVIDLYMQEITTGLRSLLLFLSQTINMKFYSFLNQSDHLILFFLPQIYPGRSGEILHSYIFSSSKATAYFIFMFIALELVASHADRRTPAMRSKHHDTGTAKY